MSVIVDVVLYPAVVLHRAPVPAFGYVQVLSWMGGRYACCRFLSLWMKDQARIQHFSKGCAQILSEFPTK